MSNFVQPSKITVKKTVKNSGRPALPNQSTRKAIPKNSTINNVQRVNNTTISAGCHEEDSKEVEDLIKKLSYNDHLESLFLENLVDEKIDRECSEIDCKMAELAKRLEINKLILRKTTQRLKDVSFLSEEQRILEEKKLYCDELLKQANEFKAVHLLDEFSDNQDLFCNRLLTKNINLGNTLNGVYEELHSSIANTVESLERVKCEYNLKSDQVKAITEMSQLLKECDGAREQIENNLKQHDSVIPQVSTSVLEVASIALANTLP